MTATKRRPGRSPAAFLVAILTMGAGAANAAGGVVGVWKTPSGGGSLIRLGPCGERLCGWVVTSPRLRAVPDQKDVLNPDPALRGRALHGLLVLEVKPLGADRWGDGWVYNPEDGGTYSAKIAMGADGAVRVTGCVAAFLCKTQIWTRSGVDKPS